MAKDILVTESLSDSMLKAGVKLIERLDADGADIQSSFWLYAEEDKIWKLIMASPLVDTEGPREYYKKIHVANSLADDLEETISLHDISVTNTSNKIVQVLKSAINTGNKIAGIRFSRNMINGIFIEDSYIYRTSK